MIADDDAELRATLRTLLPKEYEVLEASNGREAVEAAAKERPGLILLDVTMPLLCGVDALAAIKAVDPAVVVIMLTSESDIETAKEALRLGAAAYVTKPFDMEALMSEVRSTMKPEAVDRNDRPWRMKA
ncbi:MAG: response regulator [Elusimicrobiota bacterium]|nr:MAG: response regulator [Elusimicrobiota bacterium]